MYAVPDSIDTFDNPVHVPAQFLPADRVQWQWRSMELRNCLTRKKEGKSPGTFVKNTPGLHGNAQ